MLLEIRPNTKHSDILSDLNKELGHFLRSVIRANRFGKHLFTDKLKVAIYGNEKTKKKFQELWGILKNLSEADRQLISEEFDRVQDIKEFFSDKNSNLPALASDITEKLSNLTKHLFENTSHLVGIRTACNETMHEYFNQFKAANSNICCFCATSDLTQIRAGVEVNKQWRAANDHLLAKKVYPIFAVHPDNLVPICEVCNSKAKLSKDLLFIKSKNVPDVRRLAFYPLDEHCSEYVGMEVENIDLVLKAKLTMNAQDQDVLEKLYTWNDVYEIKERIEGKFLNLEVIADNDCNAVDLDDFKLKIHQKSASYLRDCRVEGWNFWKYRLYDWLDNHGNEIIDELWGCIQVKRSDPDFTSVFGI